MPKVSTKKKSEADFSGHPAEGSSPSTTIFEDLGIEDPAEKKAEKKSPGVDTDGLLARIAALESSFQRSQEVNRALMAQAPTPYQPETSQDPKFPPLPDQVSDPEGHEKGLEERIQYRIAQAQKAFYAQQNAANAQSQVANELWEEFSEKYEDLSEDPTLVEVAAVKVSRRAAKIGMDLNKYMTVGREQFLEDVATEIRKSVKRGEGGEEASRTSGIIGDPGSRPLTTKEDDTPGDMIKDLKDLQRASGLF